MSQRVTNFIQRLKKAPSHLPVFNPWWQIDEENDAGRRGPQIRRRHLECYLSARLGSAKIALIGEALGYQGGHFTGIALTSERILLGHKKTDGIDPTQVFPNLESPRTSRRSLKENGFSEPTASIVWTALLKCGLAPNKFVLWNAFPWHPYNGDKGMLSNRKPTIQELRECSDALGAFFELFRLEQIVALGNVSAKQLACVDRKAVRIRHPASGGARKFREQIAELVG